MTLLAEQMDKRLRRHHWPSQWDYILGEIGEEVGARFSRSDHRRIGPDFEAAVECVARVCQADMRINCYAVGTLVYLDGNYTVTPRGVIRPAKLINSEVPF